MWIVFRLPMVAFMHVPQSTWDRRGAGTTVEIPVHPGALGISWIEPWIEPWIEDLRPRRDHAAPLHRPLVARSSDARERARRGRPVRLARSQAQCHATTEAIP
jgi:hypothetical protein